MVYKSFVVGYHADHICKGAVMLPVYEKKGVGYFPIPIFKFNHLLIIPALQGFNHMLHMLGDLYEGHCHRWVVPSSSSLLHAKSTQLGCLELRYPYSTLGVESSMPWPNLLPGTAPEGWNQLLSFNLVQCDEPHHLTICQQAGVIHSDHGKDMIS